MTFLNVNGLLSISLVFDVVVNLNGTWFYLKKNFLHMAVNNLERIKIFNIKALSYIELLKETWVLEDKL